jgi:uncharacterized protein (TIGR03000 family)
MYSLVLMSAMTAAPDGPQFNGFFRDLFNGCDGRSSASPAGCAGYAPRYGCSGGCYGSSYPAGCGGCNGCQGWFSDMRARVRSWFDRPAGCCGGAGSSYAHGCYGSGYGCWGASYSCFGGPPVAIPSVPPDSFPYPATPGVAPPSSIPYAPPEVAPGMSGLNAGLRHASHTTVGANGPTARATVLVKLPVDARLYADGKLLALTGAERKFVTPELPAGREYAYRFRAEYERGGETVSVTKKVPVKGGATLTIEFADLTAAKTAPEKNAESSPIRKPEKDAVAATPTGNATAAEGVVPSVAPPPVAKPDAAPSAPAGERATIAVKLPPGASLFVDGRKSPSNEASRVFTTPPLPTGKEYAYVLTAEVVRNGQKETVTQKVPFRAGERVEVDFTAGR